MRHETLDPAAADPPRAWPRQPVLPVLPRLPGLLALPSRWHRRAVRRRELRRLLEVGDHLLIDVGLESAEARAEAGRPFWRPTAIPLLREFELARADGASRAVHD